MGKPGILPRIGGRVVGLWGGDGTTIVQLEDNSVVMVDAREDRVRGLVSGVARSTLGYPAGIHRDSQGKGLVFNGTVGHLQVWDSVTWGVSKLDITCQEQLNAERAVVPHNSEVERLAVGSSGVLVTVDCLWASIPR